MINQEKAGEPRVEFYWETSDEANLPTKMDDGSPIPLHSYGYNMDKGIVYFWNGSQWKEFGGNS